MSRYFVCAVLFLCPALLWAEQNRPPAPEFTQTQPEAWLNSPPLRMQELGGEVVLIKFWTYSCMNCVRSIPWVKSLEERFRMQPFRVVGVHTPEFSHERSAQDVRKKLDELGVRHPVMLDNDYAYWNAVGNRYWPAFYLVDQQGRLRYAQAGEVHQGSPAAHAMEQRIAQLFAD